MTGLNTFEDWMTLVFANFGVVMLGVAIILIFIELFYSRRKKPMSEIIFSRMVFFPLGITGIYTGFLHIFYPQLAATNIGWENSPFQFEVGMADLAIGFLGVFAFKASHGFRLATVVAATIFLWGDAIGHIIQMFQQENFSPGNAGSWFWLDVILPFILIAAMSQLKPMRRLFS